MRVGCIGTGWSTRVQIPAFRSAGLEIAGLAGHSAEKTRAKAAELDVPAFDTWQELIASDVDLISIVTPPGLHREMTLAALAAGKHVICEKPTALNAVEAAEMLAAARQHPDRITLIDHELRFLPGLQTMRAMIRRGEIGEPRHIISTVIGSSRADASRQWNWWSDAEQGGGLWGAIGSHQIDTLRFLWGEIDAISATLHTFISERSADDGMRAVTADDWTAAQLRFANGGIASLVLSLVAPVNEPNTLTIYGSEGALRLRGLQLEVAAKSGEWQDRTPEQSVEIPLGIEGNFPVGSVYLGHALRAYSDGDAAALAVGATFEDGLRNQQVLDAGYHSHERGGGWVQPDA